MPTARNTPEQLELRPRRRRVRRSPPPAVRLACPGQRALVDKLPARQKLLRSSSGRPVQTHTALPYSTVSASRRKQLSPHETRVLVLFEARCHQSPPDPHQVGFVPQMSSIFHLTEPSVTDILRKVKLPLCVRIRRPEHELEMLKGPLHVRMSPWFQYVDPFW